MSFKTTSRESLPAAGSTNVFGLIERECANEIDRVADQMVMPRSWVVSQILREWFENRTADVAGLEQSWEDSYREVLSRELGDSSQRRRAAILEVV